MKRLLALAVLLSLLSGCAHTPPEVLEPDWEPPVLEEGQETPEKESETPDWPAVFSLAYHRGQTLDPVLCGDGVQEDVASLLYEPLFRLDGGFEPEPLLCGSWESDETFRVWTLTMREDACFSDGTAVTAADAAASIRRAMTSERYAYRLRNVASAAANRSGELVITLAAPNSGFLSLLNIPVTKSGSERQGLPVGSGPYVFAEEGSSAWLEASGAWWQGKALPAERIELVHAKDRDTAAYLFTSHQTALLSADPSGSMPASAGQAEIVNVPTTSLQFIGFNTAAEEGVFSQAAARSAFSLGIQRDMLSETFLSGRALAVQLPISPVSPLYPEELETVYSQEALTAAMRAAGQDTGEKKELRMLVNEENSFRTANAQFIAEGLSTADWEITVVELPWEEYLAALELGDFDLYYGEVKLTADWDLRELIGTGGLLNYGGYTNEVTDQLLEEFSTAADRESAAWALFAHLRNTMPIAPVCFRSTAVLTYPGVVEGLAPRAGDTFFGIENWTIHLSGEENGVDIPENP